MELNNFGFGDNEVIHCPTEELAIAVLNTSQEEGRIRCSILFMQFFPWRKHKKDTCFNTRGGYGNIDFYKKNNYKVITAEEFLKQHNKNINNHKPYLVWN